MCLALIFDTNKQIFGLDILVPSNFFHFFHFLPEETGRSSYFPVSSGLPGRNTFLPEETQPCPVLCRHMASQGHNESIVTEGACRFDALNDDKPNTVTSEDLSISVQQVVKNPPIH